MSAREHVITLRLSSEEHARCVAVAKSMELPISGMLRALVRERAEYERLEGRIMRKARKKKGRS